MPGIAIAVSAIAIAASAPATRDFAPLAAGNRWVYAGDEECAGNGGANLLRESASRRISVDSSHDLADGAEFFLSYQDTFRVSPKGNFPVTVPGTRAVSGRFRVIERAGTPGLETLPFGADTLPPEMGLFFKAHDFGPDAGDTADANWELYKISTDSARYRAGAGLIYLHHRYQVYNTDTSTAPYRDLIWRAASFEGASGPAAGAAFASQPVLDFAPMAVGVSWRWKGHHRRESNGVLSEDSLDRSARVDSTVDEEGGANCLISVRDSLYARSDSGAARAAQASQEKFWVTCNPSRPNFPGFGLDWDRADMQRFFNTRVYPSDRLEELSFPGGTLQALVARDGAADLFADTLIYARGVGLVSRTKWEEGLDGASERVEYTLLEFMGKPFDGSVTALRPFAGAAARVQGNPFAAGDGAMWMRSGRNALGRVQPKVSADPRFR